MNKHEEKMSYRSLLIARFRHAVDADNVTGAEVIHACMIGYRYALADQGHSWGAESAICDEMDTEIRNMREQRIGQQAE